jgi:hypothetical protein
MAPPEASTMGLVVGARVGTHDVFHWVRILASFIQLLSLPTSMTLMPLSSMVMTRHIHDLRLGQASSQLEWRGTTKRFGRNDDDDNHNGQQEEEVDNEPGGQNKQQPPPWQHRVVFKALFNHDYL